MVDSRKPADMTPEEKDVKQIKDSLSAEVVPAVTGKNSKILKDAKKATSTKAVSATGATLHEIKEYLEHNEGTTLKEAIRKGKAAKKERSEQQYGKGGKIKYDVLNKVFGKRVGSAIGDVFDTRANKTRKAEEKEFEDLGRKFEFGGGTKQKLFGKIFGKGFGDTLSRITTRGSTKQKVYDRYKELLEKRDPHEEMAVPHKEPEKFVRPTNVAPIPTAVRNVDPNSAYARMRGIEPSAVRLTKPEVEPEVNKQLGQLKAAPTLETKTDDIAEAAKTKEREATEADRKDRKEHEKKVEADLEEIKKKIHGKGGGGLIKDLLAALMGLPIFVAIAKLLKTVGSFFTTGLPKLLAKVIGGVGKVAQTAGSAAIGGFKRLNKLTKLGKWGSRLGILGAAVDVGLGVNDLAQGKTQTELHGLEYIDPMRVGMYLGNKINEGTAAISGGTDLSEKISRWFDKENPTINRTPGPAHGIIKRPTIQAKPAAMMPGRIAEKAQEAQNQADEKADDDKDDLVGAIAAGTAATQDTIIAAAKANRTMVPPASDSGDGAVVVKVRNDEDSAAGFIADVFNHPATYGSRGM